MHVQSIHTTAEQKWQSCLDTCTYMVWWKTDNSHASNVHCFYLFWHPQLLCRGYFLNCFSNNLWYSQTLLMEPFLTNFTFNHVTILYVLTCADYFKHLCLLYSHFLVTFSPGKGSILFRIKHCNKCFRMPLGKQSILWLILSTESFTNCQCIKTTVASILLFINIDKMLG